MKMSWLTYALMTVFFWGVYGVILHRGRGLLPMGPEAPHAGLKAFLLVCAAYFIVGIVAAYVLKVRGSNWSFTSSGIGVSLLAGLAGAAGAFTLVLALGAANKEFGASAASAVMPIVFGGAPIINALVAMLLHPPEGGFAAMPVKFILGIALAATGGILVAKYAPSNTGSGGAKPGAAAPGALKH
jgi:hypothetical protein